MRLDKYLANAGTGSRSAVKAMIKKKRVEVDGTVVTDPKLETDHDSTVMVDGVRILLESHIYIMLNKPKGVISSTEKEQARTVIDLIDHPQKDELFPVGRLDKDTTGLLLITNDGKFAHELMSPKHKVGKTYIAELRDEVSQSDIQKIEHGIPLKDFTTAPAAAMKLAARKVELTITEGKYHQVKRMFQYLENEVIDLHRTHIGGLRLDDTLPKGHYRRLDENEFKLIKKV
ncbi:pseudouridine synthase [Salinicoccus hispanicus]|uniref:Pseudouridine synthase n=1 Tax=Salinicoccus hispanicus TaxID=157225 RepID=A0A6N8U2X0_9STAP|nr:pseudouridine synthase [Salinicoccus hispanicus]MXQ50521.1 pseudouridine synthase [Salinicoccus hispanicus]